MKIYNSKEVAKKLDIHITTVLQLINSGELPAKKVARKWRVTENQLRQYLEEEGDFMKKKPDLASELFNVIDQETRELFGEKEARELRDKINQKLKVKDLEPIKWKEQTINR
jgi:excisionase family DNA binding protein